MQFLVVRNAFLYYLSNFIFGTGAAIALGIIAVIITFLFQVLSQHNQDLTRRNEEKAQWMIQNSRYYLSLSHASEQICDEFSNKKNPSMVDLTHDPNDYSAEDILTNHIKFYKDYTEFEKNTSIYYFDDMDTEIFVQYLNSNILKLMTNMIGDDFTELNQFFEASKVDECPISKIFQGILSQAIQI